MKNITFGLGSLLGLVLLAPLSGGCFGDDSAPCEGSLNCSCYPNYPNDPGICKSGLVCSGNTCIPVEASTTGHGDASIPVPDATTPDATMSSGDATPTDDTTTQTTDATPSDDAPPLPPADGGGGGTNVVTNGDFSMGTMYWSVVTGNGTLTVNDSMGCVAVSANGSATLGWPEAPATTGTPLLAADSYTLTYTAVSTVGGNVSVDAKVGQTTGSFTADFETTAANRDQVTTTAMTFTHPFTPENGDDPSAGIAFAIASPGGTVTAATTVCFQNVSLVQN